MIAVALFRNLNHGQAGTPRAAGLRDLFLDAGAAQAKTVRGNGTVVFTADDTASVAARARDAVEAASSWSDIVVVRDAEWLAALAARLDGAAPLTEVTFFDGGGGFPHPLPWRPTSGRLTVVAADARHAVAVNDLPQTSFGTATMERLLGVRATSRSADTVLLAARAAVAQAVTPPAP